MAIGSKSISMLMLMLTVMLAHVGVCGYNNSPGLWPMACSDIVYALCLCSVAILIFNLHFSFDNCLALAGSPAAFTLLDPCSTSPRPLLDRYSTPAAEFQMRFSNACTHLHMHVCIYVCMYSHMYASACMCVIRTNAHICMHVYVYVCMHANYVPKTSKSAGNTTTS